MSYADEVFIKNCRDILENGFWDTEQDVRPRWEDNNAPAHTIKKFGIVNRYDCLLYTSPSPRDTR